MGHGSSATSPRRRLSGESRWRAGAQRGPAWLAARAPVDHPSPNAASVNMARAYAGTVMLEGTMLIEGRAPPARWNYSERRTSTREAESRYGANRARMAAGCGSATSGSIRHSTTRGSCQGSSSAEALPTITPRSGHGGSRRSPSRQSARLPGVRAVADFPYEYEFGNWPSRPINGGRELRDGSTIPKRGPRDLDVCRARRAGVAGNVAEHLLYCWLGYRK